MDNVETVSMIATESDAQELSRNNGTKNGERYDRLKRNCALASVCLAFTLVIAKGVVGFSSGSLAVLSSMADSLMDGVASLITLSGIALSQKPADHHHRFGHGKAEALAALIQAFIITVTTLFVVSEALGRLADPQRLTGIEPAIAVMIFAIIGTIALNLFQSYVLRRVRSMALQADRLHYIGDVALNLIVLVALVASAHPMGRLFDPLAAIAVCGMLVFGAFRIAAGAVDELLDRELPRAERKKIIEAIHSVSEVHDVHDVRTRRAGQTDFVECHVELDPQMTLEQVYTVQQKVREAVFELLPEAEINVQPDPLGIVEDRLDDRL